VGTFARGGPLNFPLTHQSISKWDVEERHRGREECRKKVRKKEETREKRGE